MISGNAPPIPCGIADYTANLLDAMLRTDRSIMPTWLSRKSRWFSMPMGRCHGVPLRRPWHKWERRGAALATRYLKWTKPSFVHLQEEYYSYMEGTASLQLVQAVRCPLIITLHAYHFDPHIEKQTKQILDRADRVICSDRRTANRLLQHTNRQADLVGWCSTPVRPTLLATEANAQANCFATFGFVHPDKMNFSVVHEALRRLKVNHRSTEWKIMGPMDPKGNPQHENLLNELNDSWVEFTGRITDLKEVLFHQRLAEMTAMLLPFRNKTGSNGTAPSRSSLQIAWAFGLPVVASSPMEDEPDLRHEENCLLVDEDDPSAWQVAVERIVNDRTLRETLREGSLASARLFGWDRLAEEHIRIYKSVSNWSS